MDCEKFEPLLLDELYDELDEVTSAAVKRHVGSCARCAATLNGLKSTRRAAVLPMVELPAGLEDRILAAAKEAQKVVPIQGRFSNVLSLAGRWAMRPQTAMAAVFLLMIGTSAFVIRTNRDAARSASVSVTEQGTPEPQPPAAAEPAASAASLDSPAAATAHGAGGAGNNFAAPPPPMAAAPTATALALAKDDELRRDRKGSADEDIAADKIVEGEKKKAGYARSGDPSNAGLPGGGAPMDQALAAAAGASQAQAPPATRAEAQDGFSAGMASYRSRNYADATKQFDSSAKTGDLNSALWAAKSTKDGSGCGPALARFESIAQKAPGTWVGSEASLEAARCQLAMGQLDAARDRLNKLAQSSSHGQQAQSTLAELNEVAAGKRSGGASAGGAAAGPVRAPTKSAAPAPAPRAVTKPTAAEGF